MIKNCYKLNARSETVISIPIANKVIENNNILIEKQELIKDVYCGEAISSVKTGKAVISILNIAESYIEITDDHINKILYHNQVDFEGHHINIDNDNCDNRINEIRKLIKSDHMNELEKDSIFKICKKYSEIFYLEGDKLTFTNAIEHTIKLKPNTQPIYKRPYRLPFSQQAEIN